MTLMNRTARNRNTSHLGADALDWDEAMDIISRLKDDGHYRNAMLVASGCFLGLRISDLLHLRWIDLCSGKPISMEETKTKKTRKLRVNPTLKTLADECAEYLDIRDLDSLIFTSQMSGRRRAMTRQRASQILKKMAVDYHMKSAESFSTHSLRKTFGRRVWLQECDKGRGDQALMLLCDVFGHSSVTITKRYLGIRQDEILSVYDTLM